MEENNTAVDIQSINKKIEKESAFVDLLTLEMGKVIVGQKHMVERLLIGLLGQGHILLEGVPGLAKTLAINTLSQAVAGSFSRIQFTPDLLPADVVGTMIYNIKANDFTIKKGPIFANFVLADEINRAPAKVQSALLEAMQEKQVTIGDETFVLDKPFLVMATQNPVEQEGTYPTSGGTGRSFHVKNNHRLSKNRRRTADCKSKPKRRVRKNKTGRDRQTNIERPSCRKRGLHG